MKNTQRQIVEKELGQVLWITGLSGSGKTTLAKALYPHFTKAILLDGDILREMLGPFATSQESYHLEKRKELAFLYARFCKMLSMQGFTVIIATISLFHDLHAWNRENLPQYCEIFLDISEETRKSRDPKGLYKKQEKGQAVMTGMEITAEFPKNPHAIIQEKETLELVIEKILEILHTEG